MRNVLQDLWRWVHRLFVKPSDAVPDEVVVASLLYERLESDVGVVALEEESPRTFPFNLKFLTTPIRRSVPVVEPVVSAKPRQKTSREPREHDTIEWSFRDTILDHLDDYFECLTRLKAHDSDAYGLFSRIGFAIPAAYKNPDHSTADMATAVALKRTMGGVLMPAVKNDLETIYASFVYFTKMWRPSKVEATPKGVEVYRVTCVYDERGLGKKLVLPYVFHVGLYEGGVVRLLREEITFYSDVRSGRDRLHLRSRQWAYPRALCCLAEDHKHSPEEEARFLFKIAFLTYDAIVDKIQIRVSKGSMVALFSILLPTAKQFFRDRQVEATSGGRRKRIFHSVVEHERELAGGQTTTVKAHYRGSRNFVWNGYDVHIVLPEIKQNFQLSSVYVEDQDPSIKMVGMAKMGEMVAERMSR